MIALGWTVVRLGPRDVLRVAASADLRWLALSLLPIVGRFLLWGFKWQRILARHAPVPYGFGVNVLIAGSFVNMTTPTAKLGGGVLRAALLNRRYGWGQSRAYGRAFADQATNVLGTVALFGVLGSVAYWTLEDFPSRTWVGLASGLTLLGLGVGISLRSWVWRLFQRPEWARWLNRWTPRRWRTDEPEEAEKRIRHVLFPLLGESTCWRTLLPDIGWATLSFAGIAWANALVLRALGVQAELPLVAVGVVIGYFAGIASGVAGGIGVTEAALTALYIHFGVPPEAAAAGALLHRAAFYLVVFSWGGASLWWLTRRTVESRA